MKDIKQFEDLPLTFGPTLLMELMDISKTLAYELANRADFPKIRVGRRIIINRNHFLVWWEKEATKKTHTKSGRGS